MRTALLLLIAGLLPGTTIAITATDPVVEELELQSKVFGNSRTLRVLLPPSYRNPDHAATRYPVCYFTDGRAAFDPDGWDVPGTATRLWASHEVPEIIIVGIDNGGSTRESRNPGLDRAQEFLPYADQSWTDQPAPVPLGKQQPAFLFTEVIPLINQHYRTRAGAPLACLAVASYGAVAALYVATQYPDSVGGLLLESPSLHIGNGQLLRDAKAATRWPACTTLGVGTTEGETAAIQGDMVRNATELSKVLPSDRSQFTVVPGAPHSFQSWGSRLPAALKFLLGSRCMH